MSVFLGIRLKKEYAKLFRGIKGKVDKSTRLALGALLIPIEYSYFDAYNESMILIGAIEVYRSRYGFYLTKVLDDKIYRNRDNLKFCKAHGIQILGTALGRSKKNVVDKELSTGMNVIV